MSAIVIGERITVVDVEDRCTYWARVTRAPIGESYDRNLQLWDGAWFELLVEDAEHGGVSNGDLSRALSMFDEGVVWIRGWHTPHEPAAAALLAVSLLDGSATTV